MPVDAAGTDHPTMSSTRWNKALHHLLFKRQDSWTLPQPHFLPAQLTSALVRRGYLDIASSTALRQPFHSLGALLARSLDTTPLSAWKPSARRIDK